MKNLLQKIFAIVILMIAIQITITAQTVGSQIKTDTSGHISYWNGIDTWIPVAPGLPGQNLQFTAGVPAWINNPNGITTAAVSNITGTTAINGGNILSDGGAKITAKGVCWSTSANPTIADNKTIDGSGIGSFTSNITGLTEGTSYFVRAYANTSAGTVYGNEINFITLSQFICGSSVLIDFDGNQYNTVLIGNQCWMKQNLKTTHFNNGTPIPLITNETEWANLTTSAYCWYNNQASNGNTYGALYNSYTVNNANICPTGWHIPSSIESSELSTYLGGDLISGGKIKEIGLTHWNSPNEGATNESGFTALPSGSRQTNGTFSFIGSRGYIWVMPSGTMRAMLVSNDVATLYSGFIMIDGSGAPIRCIKN